MSPPLAAPLLAADGLTRSFQGLVAVDGLSFQVAPHTIHALIGPNGAGKTTLFNLVSGLLPPSGGSLHFQGRDITGLGAHRRAALGMGRTFQNLRMFGGMTVLENVLTGRHARLPATWLATLLRLPAARAEERAAIARAEALLARVGLAGQAGRPAGELSYGEQRRLEIARALAGEPALLLLDEPAAGMNPTETAELAALLRQLAAERRTILLVEHDMGFVMGLCDRVTVLNFGRRIAEGTPAEVRADPAVVDAYLGARVARRLMAAAEGAA